MDNELLLLDRIAAIKDTINQYGADNFYLSFSGGKDSTVLHYLIDEALPGNEISRVFINTGIEYAAIVDFVKDMAEKDKRFVMLKPSQPIKAVLEKHGYPFKSKEHAKKVDQYQRLNNLTPYLERYLNGFDKPSQFACPSILKYQFTPSCKLKISHLCCDYLKKKPVSKWAKENGKNITITGIRAEEGGARIQKHVGCIVKDKKGGIKKLHPLIKIDDDFEEWYIKRKNIKLCDLYYSPFNFKRTGCKGCPFAVDLQEQLSIMDKYMPAERKQCEYIWQPVYEEYRRIGYRLDKNEQMKLL